jgi:NAD(P)-dependent dehydrogenase (short-subunit alcohol dehydrogenase family)
LPDSYGLKGRVALITGGGRGIGRAIALALARAGATVSLVARSCAELDETAALILNGGGQALAIMGDVSRPQTAINVVAKTTAYYGSVDILVNCAGIHGTIGLLVEAEVHQWRQAIEVNLIGTFLFSRAVLPDMMARRWGRIINLAGGGAAAPRPRFTAYAASKAAVVRLTETLAEEVRDYNIQVNAIAPGPVNTKMLTEILAAGSAAGAESASAMGQRDSGGIPPELAAELTLFLASERSAGLTGKLISAPHDDWRNWDAPRIVELMRAPWLTLRRLDRHTLKQLTDGKEI